MRAALLILLLLSAGASRAETVAIVSGEHEGFSRIVLDLSEPTPWQFGRTPDGYELRLAREDIRFDLRQVFRTIPRTRLASVWADPETGDLQLGIGCACHAMPFEFRDDIIVIDIKDGPPPPGSSFEMALGGSAMPALAGRAPPRPRLRPAAALPGPADWARQFREGQAPAITMPSAALQDMRETLLRQLGRSASQGLVDMALPLPGVAEDMDPTPGFPPEGQVTTSFVPGVRVVTPRDPEPDLTPEGATCIEDSRLEVVTWADDRPFVEQYAETRALAVGEFDRPDPEVIGRQTRLLLYFGFGAEARETLAAFGVEPADAALWETMAFIVDGDPVGPDNPFAGQADCDTNAALWSVLSRPELKLSDRPRVRAVLRAFSGLPPGLRRQLGPGLAERFLSIDDAASARAVRDAILRAPGDPGDATELAEARIDLHDGRPDEAATRIEDVASEGGPMLPRALIDLVEARLAQGAPVDAETVIALSALVREQGNGPLGPELRRAEGLALASGGDFASAFAISAAGDPEFDDELWPLLATVGPDSALLAQAVLPRDAVPATDGATATAIAGRLIDLGFPDAGLAWLPPVNGDEARTLLAARAELARRDARAALRLLAGQLGPEAERLRAEAQVQLGDPVGASAAFAAAGDAAAAERALWQGRDWAAVAVSEADPVLAAAAALALPVPPDPGPGLVDQVLPGLPLPPVVAPPTTLARGRALIEDSAGARAAVEAMLEAMPAPEIAQP
jgi:hypothetical protein